jgi:hypothetical protein
VVYQRSRGTKIIKSISTLLLSILFPRLRRHNVYCSASGTSEGAR